MVIWSQSGVLRQPARLNLHCYKTSPPTPLGTTCYMQALKVPEWCAAMLDEHDALMRSNTWVLVPPSLSQNIIGVLSAALMGVLSAMT